MFTPLQELTFTSQLNVDFPLPVGWRTVMVIGHTKQDLDNFIPQVRLSNDGGVTFRSGLDYTLALRVRNPVDGDGNTGASGSGNVIQLTGSGLFFSLGAAVNEIVNFWLTFHTFREAGLRTVATIHSQHFNLAGVPVRTQGGGSNLTAEDNDFARLTTVSTALLTGAATLFGMAR